MDALTTITAALGANALVLGALTYLVKTLISNRLDRDMAQFRSDLERKAGEEMERFRSQLEKERIRLQVSYDGIFEKQAEAILEVHRAVVQLEGGAAEAIHFGGTLNDRRQRMEKPLAELRHILLDKSILLPPKVDEAIASFLAKLPRAVRSYISAESRDLTRLSNGEMENLFNKQDKAMEIIEEEIPTLRKQLITEMRRVIGVVADEF